MFLSEKTNATLSPDCKGRFVVFEGPDGAGKDTILKMVYDKLLADHKIFSMEIESEPSAKSIRNYWLKENHSPSATALAMIADRIDHVHQTLIPALNKGRLILCSRYDMSTYVYNVYYGDCLDLVKDFVEEMDWLLSPHLYVVVDADLEVLYTRTHADRQLETTSRDDSDMSKTMLRELKRGYKSAMGWIPDERLFYFKNNYPIEHPKTHEKVNRIVKRILSIYPTTPTTL